MEILARIVAKIVTPKVVKLEIRRIGNSLGANIPPELLEKLMVREGDFLYVTETSEGILLSPHDPELTEIMEVAKDVSSRYKNALKKLAE